jgi:hypothetical protein
MCADRASEKNVRCAPYELGGKYFVEPGTSKCWWMYAYEMVEDPTEEETRKTLGNGRLWSGSQTRD